MHSLRTGGRTLSIPTIKRWREKQSRLKKPSTLEDYFAQHDLCPRCGGLGRIKIDSEGSGDFRRDCTICQGSGRQSVKGRPA